MFGNLFLGFAGSTSESQRILKTPEMKFLPQIIRSSSEHVQRVLLLTTQFTQSDHCYRHRRKRWRFHLGTSFRTSCSQTAMWHLISGPNTRDQVTTHGSHWLDSCWCRFVLSTTGQARLIAAPPHPYDVTNLIGYTRAEKNAHGAGQNKVKKNVASRICISISKHRRGSLLQNCGNDFSLLNCDN